MTIINDALRVAALAVASLSLGQAHAHHSYASFDRCNATTLDGEIINIEWVKVLSLVSQIRRPRDGWTWQGAARPPPACAAG